jgi:FecR, C-terminal
MKRFFSRNGLRKNLENIDADKFLDMLHDKMEGKTDWRDECILEELIRTNPFARELFEDMKATYPNARLRIRCRTRVIRSRALIAVFLFFTFGLGYALFYLPHKTTSCQQRDHGFYQVRMKDIMDSVQKLYNVKVVLDPGIVEIRCSGVLDPTIPLKQFLDNITWINRLEYYFDAVGVVHVRKIPPADNRRQ